MCFWIIITNTEIKLTSSHSFWNVENSVASRPVAPLLITYTKSCVNTNGTRSLQNPNFSLKWPKICPKSM